MKKELAISHVVRTIAQRCPSLQSLTVYHCVRCPSRYCGGTFDKINSHSINVDVRQRRAAKIMLSNDTRPNEKRRQALNTRDFLLSCLFAISPWNQKRKFVECFKLSRTSAN